MKKGIIIVVSGFSGAGKGTIIRRLLEKHENYMLSVSMTTRAPRPGETEGKDYFFTDQETFERTIREGGLLEHANYGGNYYGTPRAFVESMLAEGKDVLLEIEVQGALQIRERFPEALLIYVVPPGVRLLRERLTSRATETPEVIEKRLRLARGEARYLDRYDYIAMNDDLEACVEDVHGIVNAARHATVRNGALIKQMQEELEQVMPQE